MKLGQMPAELLNKFLGVAYISAVDHCFVSLHKCFLPKYIVIDLGKLVIRVIQKLLTMRKETKGVNQITVFILDAVM